MGLRVQLVLWVNKYYDHGNDSDKCKYASMASMSCNLFPRRGDDNDDNYYYYYYYYY